LRRTRIGLCVAQGGAALLGRVRACCQPALGWDDARWDRELARYQDLWRGRYSVPPRERVPAWTTT
ncbi:MAG: FAD-dependent oxidoreductase, partial [Myxococcales bacterium]|nr:FAD-dependent oxidoreductase [Myxococcales bacterium]